MERVERERVAKQREREREREREPAGQLVLCDEATSALDSGTEAWVLQALSGAGAGAGTGGPPTRVVVAPRLSTSAAADRIAVLDAGRVVEQGTHAELLAAAGLYARMWEQQQQQAPH